MTARRYFFALFPDESVREKLLQTMPAVLQNTHGNLMHPLDWHITLAFIGNLTKKNKEEDLLFAIKNHTVEPFDIELVKVAYWPDSRIVWLGLRETPETLLQLVSAINSDLKTIGFKPDTRPYEPHMTLIRGTPKPSIIERIEPIRWQVNEFALAYSMPPTSDGIRYTVRNRWLLHKST